MFQAGKVEFLISNTYQKSIPPMGHQHTQKKMHFIALALADQPRDNANTTLKSNLLRAPFFTHKQ